MTTENMSIIGNADVIEVIQLTGATGATGPEGGTAALTVDGNLLTRAAGVPAQITRAALAAELAVDPAFIGAYLSSSVELSRALKGEPDLIVDDCSYAGHWSGANGTVTAVTTDPLNPRVLNFATTTQAGVTFTRNSWFSIPHGGAVALRIKRDANLAALNVYVRSNLYGTSKVYSTNDGLTPVPVGEWFDLILQPAYLGPPSGPSPSHMQSVCSFSINPTPTGGQDTTLQLSSFRVVKGSPTPRVAITFDDGFASTYATAYPILTAAGLVGSINVAYDKINTAGYLTTAQLQELHTAGWGMMGHANGTISGTEATAETTFKAAKDFLITNGLTRGSSHWAWPGGSRDAARDKFARRYWKTRRGTASMTSYATFGAVEPYDVPVMYTLSSTTLAAHQGRVDRVRDYGGAIIFAFHDLVPTTKVAAEDWLISDFTTLVQYAVAQGLVGCTYDDLFGTLAPA